MKIEALLQFGLLSLLIGFTQCTPEKKENNLQISVADSAVIKLNVLLASLNESATLCTEISKAASGSTNPELRSVGEKLANVNATLLREVRDLAAARKIDLPDSLPEDKIKRLNYMNKKTGAEFDRRVSRLLVNEHRIFFTRIRQARDLDDSEVKAFAERNKKTIADMRENLRGVLKMRDRNRSKAEAERPS